MGENEPCRSPLAITCDSSDYTNIMAVRVVEFSKGVYKRRKMFAKESILLNFENQVNGEVSKSAKFDFKSQISMSKIIQIFRIFLFTEEYQFSSTFFVIDIF